MAEEQDAVAEDRSAVAAPARGGARQGAARGLPRGPHPPAVHGGGRCCGSPSLPAAARAVAAAGRVFLAQPHLSADRRRRAGAAAGRAAGRDRPGPAPAAPGLMAAPVVSALLQNAVVWTGEPLQPKLERISPLAGAKRLFSGRALLEFGKSLAKLALVGTALAMLLWPEAPAIVAASRLEAGTVPELARRSRRSHPGPAGAWPRPSSPSPTTGTSTCSSCGRCGCRGARCRTSTSRATAIRTSSSASARCGWSGRGGG